MELLRLPLDLGGHPERGEFLPNFAHQIVLWLRGTSLLAEKDLSSDDEGDGKFFRYSFNQGGQFGERGMPGAGDDGGGRGGDSSRPVDGRDAVDADQARALLV